MSGPTSEDMRVYPFPGEKERMTMDDKSRIWESIAGIDWGSIEVDLQEGRDTVFIIAREGDTAGAELNLEQLDRLIAVLKEAREAMSVR